MEIDEKNPPLFLLTVDRSESRGIFYIITPNGDEEGRPAQAVFFNSTDYSIDFIEPLSPFYQYLLENEKWLRSILFTTLKNSDRESRVIPFSFPSKAAPAAVPENGVKVYCDGSCSKGGNGGWSGLILFSDKEAVEISGGEGNSSSNRMELMAALRSLQKAEEIMGPDKQPALLLTDSHYVIFGLTHRLQVWRRNGFITAYGTPVINRELWEEMEALTGRIEVHCVKVNSATEPCHRQCDETAGKIMRGEL